MKVSRGFRTGPPISLIFSLVILLSSLIATVYADQEAIKHDLGIYYTVQKGDSLWSISKRFFDSPAYWPELWRENPEIKNPYELKPGTRIRLFSKTGLKKITSKALKAAMTQQADAAFMTYSPIDAVGFVKRAPVPALGAINKADGDKLLISEGDRVFIRKNQDAGLAIGETYFVYRTLLFSIRKDSKPTGVQHLMTGLAKLTEIKPDYAVAMVAESLRQIKNDDQLMPYEQRSPRITLKAPITGLKGRLVAAENRQFILGEGSVAFIDRGQKDGVMPGQHYLLYEQIERHAKKGEGTAWGPIDYGIILVLVAEEDVSTVLITQADKNVSPGALFRSPSMAE